MQNILGMHLLTFVLHEELLTSLPNCCSNPKCSGLIHASTAYRPLSLTLPWERAIGACR